MSIFDHSDGVTPAPTWRCPRCRTLQAETTQCWRCAKQAYTCEDCRHYRPSVADDLGSCAADPTRAPMLADEARSCWVPPTDLAPPALAATPPPPQGLFAELELAPPAPVARSTSVPPAPKVPQPRTREKPPLEEPGRAAWVEPDQGELVEAPVVEPGARITTELHRRRRRWFR